MVVTMRVVECMVMRVYKGSLGVEVVDLVGLVGEV